MTQAVGGGTIPNKYYKEGDEMVDTSGATFKLVNGAWVMIRNPDGTPVAPPP